MPALATWTPEDALLGALAPLGLAIAAPGPALVVDLAGGSVWDFDSSSLAALVAEGPRRADLQPGRGGVAVLRNGGIATDDAIDVVRHLVAGWPFVVLRVSSPLREWPSIPVVPLLPGGLTRRVDGRVAYQDVGWGQPPPGPGPRLAIPRRRTWDALARGLRPAPDRWVRSLRQLWSWA